MFEPLYSLPTTTEITVEARAFAWPTTASWRWAPRSIVYIAAWKRVTQHVQMLIDQEVMPTIVSRSIRSVGSRDVS